MPRAKSYKLFHNFRAAYSGLTGILRVGFAHEANAP